MRRSDRPVARAVAFVTMVVALAGCGLEATDLRADGDLDVVSPGPRATVDVPFTMSWTATDAPDVAMYALFLNQAPMPPGRAISWLARDDDACRSTPGCPDEAWLRDRGVYITAAHSIEVTAVPEPGPGLRQRSDDGMRAVVVPLDADGRRLDGHAGTRLFYLAAKG